MRDSYLRLLPIIIALSTVAAYEFAFTIPNHHDPSEIIYEEPGVGCQRINVASPKSLKDPTPVPRATEIFPDYLYIRTRTDEFSAPPGIALYSAPLGPTANPCDSADLRMVVAFHDDFNVQQVVKIIPEGVFYWEEVDDPDMGIEEWPTEWYIVNNMELGEVVRKKSPGWSAEENVVLKFPYDTWVWGN
ncbi:hypothetical protein ABW19_dt0207321 [Dactylella cylindrospora]|nr:hypothetical protein ABW19_dt0207321 [Dactylella cylindrospora]